MERFPPNPFTLQTVDDGIPNFILLSACDLKTSAVRIVGLSPPPATLQNKYTLFADVNAFILLINASIMFLLTDFIELIN